MELSRPFAENGDRIDFPETAQGDGDLSLEQGFGPRFALPPEESGLFIDRQKYNQLMYLVTKGVIDAKEAVKLMQQKITEAEQKITTELAKLTEFGTRLDSLEDEVANIDESLNGGKVITLIDEDVFITVGNPGSGAQFERLEDALYEGMKYKPINNHFVFVVLKTNITIDYTISLSGVDMSHIIISGWFDGTQGQVKPPMKEWKRIYYDVANAVDRAVAHNQSFTAALYVVSSQPFAFYNVVWSMKEPVDMTDINTKYSKIVLSYNNALFIQVQGGGGNFTVAPIEADTRLAVIKTRYNLDYSIEADYKGLTGTASGIITANNAFICYGGNYCVALSWCCFLNLYKSYLRNGYYHMTPGGSGDITSSIYHYTNKTPIIPAYSYRRNAVLSLERSAHIGLSMAVVTKEDAIGYDYVFDLQSGAIASFSGITTAPDLFYGKAPNIGLATIANNTVTADGILMSYFTYEQAKAALRPYPTVYDEIYPDEPNWNKTTDYNPNTAWKPATE